MSTETPFTVRIDYGLMTYTATSYGRNAADACDRVLRREDRSGRIPHDVVDYASAWRATPKATMPPREVRP